MQQFLRPHSGPFRAILMMALLAWTALAFGAPTAPMSVADVTGAETMTHVAMTSASMPHCNDAPVSQQAPPAMPPGDAGCCHAGCLCPATSGAVMAVAAALTTAPLPAGVVRVPTLAEPVAGLAAPPLRPPIA